MKIKIAMMDTEKREDVNEPGHEPKMVSLTETEEKITIPLTPEQEALIEGRMRNSNLLENPLRMQISLLGESGPIISSIYTYATLN